MDAYHKEIAKNKKLENCHIGATMRFFREGTRESDIFAHIRPRALVGRRHFDWLKGQNVHMDDIISQVKGVESHNAFIERREEGRGDIHLVDLHFTVPRNDEGGIKEMHRVLQGWIGDERFRDRLREHGFELYSNEIYLNHLDTLREWWGIKNPQPSNDRWAFTVTLKRLGQVAAKKPVTTARPVVRDIRGKALTDVPSLHPSKSPVLRKIPKLQPLRPPMIRSLPNPKPLILNLKPLVLPKGSQGKGRGK